MPLKCWHMSVDIQSVTAVTPSLTYMDWAALHCWPTAGYSLSDVHLCISCMVPFSSKLRHCSLYTCLSCCSISAAVPPSILLPLAHCMLHSTHAVYTDVLPHTIHLHVRTTLSYILHADLSVWCSWSPHTVQRVV